jgi:hypothetical protein
LEVKYQQKNWEKGTSSDYRKGSFLKRLQWAGCQWLIAVIRDAWEAEAGRIIVQGQSRQMFHETSISKITRGADGRCCSSSKAPALQV